MQNKLLILSATVIALCPVFSFAQLPEWEKVQWSYSEIEGPGYIRIERTSPDGKKIQDIDFASLASVQSDPSSIPEKLPDEASRERVLSALPKAKQCLNRQLSEIKKVAKDTYMQRALFEQASPRGSTLETLGDGKTRRTFPVALLMTVNKTNRSDLDPKAEISFKPSSSNYPILKYGLDHNGTCHSANLAGLQVQMIENQAAQSFEISRQNELNNIIDKAQTSPYDGGVLSFIFNGHAKSGDAEAEPRPQTDEKTTVGATQ